MSRSLNKITLIGNLGADPEIRTTTGGNKMAQFSVATSRQWTSASGEKQEKTEWHRCIAWNAKGTGLADIIERYVKKGDKIYVEGRVEYRQYEDKDKVTKYITEINVREILLLGGGRGGDSGFEGGSRAKATAGAKAGANAEGFEEFPSAMDGDDDLPF
ncbi:MAG: single-stranded DNA-binding protein [Gemmatimonadales bacterium]|nr:single-stranded DNA-binding protein [Gemmatimonadota bacterium]MCL4214381.1 single-stranded DNA-binding protein [Gemmatimonadales bacterium]